MYWRRERGGWGEWEKAESAGEKMVREEVVGSELEIERHGGEGGEREGKRRRRERRRMREKRSEEAIGERGQG